MPSTVTLFNVHTDSGDFYETYGVPNSWGFLLFCAAWTFLVAIFLLIAAAKSKGYALFSYICFAVEAIALVSWTAGFIAVAVNISTGECSAESCGLLKTAVVFGALEWVLFVVTTTMTAVMVLNNTRLRKTSASRDAIAMSSVA